jgi:hypothetical protein
MRKSTNVWAWVFKKWVAFRNMAMGENLKTCKVEELDEVLSRFLYTLKYEKQMEKNTSLTALRLCKHL